MVENIREFVERDWSGMRLAKDLYWHERIARLGPLEGIRIADELRQQLRAQDPAWPSAADRDEDLRAHARVAHLLRRARPASRA